MIPKRIRRFTSRLSRNWLAKTNRCAFPGSVGAIPGDHSGRYRLPDVFVTHNPVCRDCSWWSSLLFCPRMVIRVKPFFIRNEGSPGKGWRRELPRPAGKDAGLRDDAPPGRIQSAPLPDRDVTARLGICAGPDRLGDPLAPNCILLLKWEEKFPRFGATGHGNHPETSGETGRRLLADDSLNLGDLPRLAC